MRETLFYFTGLHCSLNIHKKSVEQGGTLEVGSAYAKLTTEDSEVVDIVVDILPNSNYIITRDYLSVLDGSGTDITDRVYDPEENIFEFDNAGTYTTVIIKVAGLSNIAYTSVYTGQQVDESINYSNLIKADRPAPDAPVDTPTPATNARINAATLEGRSSEYFCPATREATPSSLGLIRRGTGFVLEDGKLSTDITVDIQIDTQTLDLNINMHQE